jgi:amino acid transporter
MKLRTHVRLVSIGFTLVYLCASAAGILYIADRLEPLRSWGRWVLLFGFVCGALCIVIAKALPLSDNLVGETGGRPTAHRSGRGSESGLSKS